ncbi:SusC/RagA family TonB-linked outer membrane protein [Bergeyella cardium]|uniref:SusC/RagA family TonB-linked outer membrane protein n=2 Tax=Bergeyella cardium TaxID=1585976 RepID=UPI001FE6FF46|nr:SusC/RagA family TonB-linked outer membrane protein [Bergeyella cardium]
MIHKKDMRIKVLSAGVWFFLGQTMIMAQTKKTDSTKVTSIDEVVVVAYGKQKKEAIVGAVSSVDSKTLKTQQATNIGTALQGSTAGVNIYNTSGQPGSSPSIYIRGVGSMSASTYPLIILDGVPFNGNLSSIPQDQIESMTVLKDAASSALYGSRAANGVIVITTKNGRLNAKPSFNLTSLVGVSSPGVKLHKLLGAEDFMKYTWQALRNSQLYTYDAQGNLTIGNSAAAGQYASDNLITTLGYNPYNVARPIDENGNVVNGAGLRWDTNWEDAVLNKAAFKQEHRFDVSGGSANTRYFFATDYLKMDGMVRSSNFERVGVRMNMDSKLKPWLNAGLRTAFNASNENIPTQSGYEGGMAWIYRMPNIYPIYKMDANGQPLRDAQGHPILDYGNGTGINSKRPSTVGNNDNILGDLKYDKTLIRRYNTLVNGYMEATLAPYLTFKSQLGYEFYIYDSYSYSNNRYGYVAATSKGSITQVRNINQTINFTNSLNYNQSFGEHNLNGQGIFEVYQYTYEPFSATATGFLTGVDVLDGASVKKSITGNFYRERLVSYLGRLSYNYGGKYFLEGSFRTDGSTRFSKNTRWGLFYSGGFSWVISKENFLKDSKNINNLKLRASYGELGNNKTDSYFPYITLYNAGYNQGENPGVVLGGVSDRDLRWEKTATVNAGLDFAILKKRINGSVEYFERSSVDLIYAKPLPGSTGNKSIVTNIASLKNYGWEANLNTVNVESDNFTWNSNFNISFVKNKITKFPQKELLTGTKRWEEGRSLYDFFLPEWAGVNPDTGLAQWYINDANGNRVTTTDYNEANKKENRIYKGSSLPDFTGGFTNYFKYKNLDLNILFNFSFGSYIYDYTYAGLMSGLAAVRQQSEDIKNAWTPDNRYTDVPALLYGTQDANKNAASYSTRFLFKNNYIRLKSLTLGYNLPKEMLEGIGAKSLRFFVQADNLWTWQSHKGIDPEQGVSGTTDDRTPSFKTISAGFTLGF